MAEETKERKPWTDSDRALAYVMFRSAKTGGIRIGEKQCRAIARSRIVVRTDGSWSRKLANYTQADKYLRGETSEPAFTGNAEKREFPELEALWEKDHGVVLSKASEEIIIRDDEALELFRSMGFADDSLRRGDPISFDRVSRLNVISAISLYSQGARPDGYKDSTDYDLLHEGRTYPPKMIMGMAYKLATGEAISGAMFDGGLNTPCFNRLEELSFKLIPKATPLGQNFMNYEQRLICALAAKPFVILAGGTGTGKTKSAIETVKKLCRPTADGKKSDQFEVIAVGADWTDTRPLLGYVNLLIENGPAYSSPAALQLILRAHKNAELPYFLILDEMNLSHVERYFSDFLSLMEAKKIDKSAAAIKLHSQSGDMKAAEAGATDVPAEIPWPANLYVIGTVNIDETTHMFSPKVLDRAHVIEYKVEWDSNPDQGDNGHTIVRGLDQMVAPKSEDAVSSTRHWDLNGILVKPAEDRLRGIDEKEAMAKSIEPIGKLWEELRGTRFAFSHRTAQEAIGYVLTASNLAKTHREIVGAPSTEHLIDLAVLQKILPKINGSADVLTRRAKHTSPQPGKTMNQSGPLLTKLAEICEKLPLSSAKLRSMQATLDTEHFVSFIQ